jgi:hypothetical protein
MLMSIERADREIDRLIDGIENRKRWLGDFTFLPARPYEPGSIDRGMRNLQLERQFRRERAVEVERQRAERLRREGLERLRRDYGI